METFTDQTIRKLLANSLKTAQLDETGWYDVGSGGGSSEADFIDWLTIGEQTESVYADVKRIRFHPLVPPEIPIYGYLYDVKIGKLIEIPQATAVGKAST